jgi:Domain of unknown function (DUF5666)
MVNVARPTLILAAVLMVAVALGQSSPAGIVNFYGVITGVTNGEFQILTNPNADPQSAYKQERKTIDFDRATAFEGSAQDDLKVARGVQVVGLAQKDGKILATKIVVYEGNAPVRQRKDLPVVLPKGQTR